MAGEESATDGAVADNVDDQSTDQTDDQQVDGQQVDDQQTDQQDDQSTDDGKAPEEYADFELPEGVELDETMLEKAVPLFKDLGLNQEKAQEFINLAAEMRQADAQALQEAHTEQVETWEQEAMKDKEFGGDAFEENAAIAQKGIEAFGSPELKQFFNETGIGNHPELFKFAVRVGKTVVEDNPSGGNPPGSDKSTAEVLYGSEGE